MAKRKPAFIGLNPQTKIEVIGIKHGKTPVKKIMTIAEADQLPKKNGWSYVRYQLGFSQYKLK